MIYLQATLTLAPGKSREFNEFLGEKMVPCWEKYGAKLIGTWETAVGTMNEVTDLWSFDSMGHFEEAFRSLIRDPDMRSAWPIIPSIILGEKNKLLRPLPCSPLK